MMLFFSMTMLDVVQPVQDLRGRMSWEVLQYPPYGPNLFPCNFHVFIHSKNH